MPRKKQPDQAAATPPPITDEQVQAKRAACGFQLSAAQCREVLEAQAAHDATDPHDEPPAHPIGEETAAD